MIVLTNSLLKEPTKVFKQFKTHRNLLGFCPKINSLFFGFMKGPIKILDIEKLL